MPDLALAPDWDTSPCQRLRNIRTRAFNSQEIRKNNYVTASTYMGPYEPVFRVQHFFLLFFVFRRQPYPQAPMLTKNPEKNKPFFQKDAD